MQNRHIVIIFIFRIRYGLKKKKILSFRISNHIKQKNNMVGTYINGLINLWLKVREIIRKSQIKKNPLSRKLNQGSFLK